MRTGARAEVHADIARQRAALADLCRTYEVARLELFGSAAGEALDAGPASDADFLVTFRPNGTLPPLEQFFGLAAALEELLGRPVDLVEAGAIRNPYVLAGIRRSRELLYAA